MSDQSAYNRSYFAHRITDSRITDRPSGNVLLKHQRGAQKTNRITQWGSQTPKRAPRITKNQNPVKLRLQQEPFRTQNHQESKRITKVLSNTNESSKNRAKPPQNGREPPKMIRNCVIYALPILKPWLHTKKRDKYYYIARDKRVTHPPRDGYPPGLAVFLVALGGPPAATTTMVPTRAHQNIFSSPTE